MNNYFILEEILNEYISKKDNDLCLCGSGKRFSDCHKVTNKSNLKLNPFNISKKMNKINQPKLCYYQDNNCSTVHSFSHSIPIQSLENIQYNRHLLKFESLDSQLNIEILNSYSAQPEKIGINKIGCYYGFCSFHDTTIFAPIETSVIIPNKNQVALSRLRSLTKEIYIKTQTTKFIPIANEIASTEKNKNERVLLAAYHSQFSIGTFKVLVEFAKELAELKKAFNLLQFNKYNSIIYVLDNLFPIHCCAFVYPIFSFNGKVIQDFNNLSKVNEYFSMNSFFKDNKTYVIFSWKKNSILDYFFHDFQLIKMEFTPSFLIQFIFAYSENHAISPIWWDSLPLIKKKRLIRLFFDDIVNDQSRINPITEFRSYSFSECKLIDVITL